LEIIHPSKFANSPFFVEENFQISLDVSDCAEKTIGMGKVNPEINNCWECAKYDLIAVRFKFTIAKNVLSNSDV